MKNDEKADEDVQVPEPLAPETPPEPEPTPEPVAPDTPVLTGPAWLVHNSSLGELWVNGVGPVEAGVPFHVTAELGTSLLEQHELYQITDAPEGEK